MTTLAKFMIIAGADNRPPLLEKSLPTVTEADGTTRTKKYEELFATEKIQADCDCKATNIFLQGLPPDVYAIDNHHKVSKEIWDRVKLLMQGTKLSLQEKQCKLYDEFDKFTFVKGETLLLPEWSKFVMDVKLARDLRTTNYVQLCSYLEQHEVHANETRLMRERYQDPLSFVANYNQPPYQLTNYHSQYNPTHVPQQTKNMIPQVHSPQSFSPISRYSRRSSSSDYHFNTAAFQIDDLVAFDFDFNDVSHAKAVLMANLSSYGSDVLSEVPHFETSHNDMGNQSVHAMQDFEQIPIVDFSDNEITSDSNIISYSKYLQETQLETVQDTNFVISDKHVASPVVDDKETLILEEVNRSKMLAKQNNLISKEKKFNTTPINYAKLNRLSEYFVVQAKEKQPIDNALDLACKHATRIQESLVYAQDTCPNAIKLSEKKVAITPMNKVKKVRFSEPLTSSSNIKHAESSRTSNSNTHVLSSTGLKCSTSTYRSQPTCNKKNDMISQKSSSNRQNKVEDQPRKLNKKNRVKEPVKHTMLNVNSWSICVKCKQCMFDANHDVCFLDFVNDVNKHAKSKSKSKKSQVYNIWKPTGKVVTDVGLKWKPTGRLLTIVGYSCPLTRNTPKKIVHLKETTSNSVETPNQRLKSIVGDVRFLRSKDETPDAVIKCIKKIQVRLNATVHNFRTDNETEFVNQTLRDFYENVSISYQTSVARTPQQYGVVESSGPGLQSITPATTSLGLIPNHIPQQPCHPSNRDNLDRLFQPMFGNYFSPLTIVVSLVAVAAAPRTVDTTDSHVSTSIDLDAPSTSEWFKKDCIDSVTTWENLVEKFVQKFYQLSYDNEEVEAKEDDDPDDITDIFKIKGNLFNYETPLDLEEPWSDNEVPYQLCDHICEPYHFKNGITKWTTCSSDIDGFCNGGELPGMVQGYEECMDVLTHEPSVSKIKRFKMMKYSFNADEEYIAIKDSEYLNDPKENLDAY
uniref:Ribonuclease H-like domain-containing protein n=1 Tax=Tanacetum cinerariifolium TaxID=118510 RepID=A0A6L2J119_TANCI|nr:ribonuclease H-like domain-containing protein [Tanacetum cinerariifolium]